MHRGQRLLAPARRHRRRRLHGRIDAGNSIELTSAEQSIAGIAGSALTLTKQFSPVPGSGAIDVTYTLTNVSPTDSVSLAPWQVSRVATGGLTFFGQGSGPVTYAPDTASTFTVNEMAGALWYLYEPVTHDSKAFADGTGWIAQVTPDRLLYLVSYPDFEPADGAPGEAEIELYTNSSGVYVEFEQQGALAAIAPGASMTWTVRWKLRRLPAGTTVAPGNAEPRVVRRRRARRVGRAIAWRFRLLRRRQLIWMFSPVAPFAPWPPVAAAGSVPPGPPAPGVPVAQVTLM